MRRCARTRVCGQRRIAPLVRYAAAGNRLSCLPRARRERAALRAHRVCGQRRIAPLVRYAGARIGSAACARASVRRCARTERERLAAFAAQERTEDAARELACDGGADTACGALGQRVDHARMVPAARASAAEEELVQAAPRSARLPARLGLKELRSARLQLGQRRRPGRAASASRRPTRDPRFARTRWPRPSSGSARHALRRRVAQCGYPVAR